MATTPLVLIGLACGTAPGIPTPDPGPEPARGVPGFDTRDYPGRAAMATWLEASPYRWVGFYLPAPCYTGTSWQGKRDELLAVGWELAVLFVGEQDWAESAPDRSLAPADSTAPRCTRTNLTRERGGDDAIAAADAAAAEGFPAGTWIYLDVEHVAEVSPELERYVSAWTTELLRDGRYLPGLYAHDDNATALLTVAQRAFEGAERPERPRLWVAKTDGFTLRRGPEESGFPAAAIWQGRLDVRETWGGVTLRIDANVARSDSPSS